MENKRVFIIRLITRIVVLLLLSHHSTSEVSASRQIWNELEFIRGSAHGMTTIEKDSLITNVKVRIEHIDQPVLFDICLNLGHTSTPVYNLAIGGYSEVYCWTVSRHATQDNYESNLSLIDTPLYVPKGSLLYCASSSSASNKTTRFSCEIDLKDYERGMERYRSLRFPYTDMASLSDGSLSSSYYISSSIFPLEIKKVGIFQSFGGDTTSSTADGCLKWVKQGGSIVKEACFPQIRIEPNQNYETPPALDIDWKIDVDDLLTASCQNTRSNTDCGIWAITKIPDRIKPDRDNIFTEYNNVPLNYLNNWCNENFEATKPVFCNQQTSCERNDSHAKCMALFPKASCISDNSCFEAMPGDLDGDGSVNFVDFNLLISSFGNPYTIVDFNNIISNYGK